MAELVQCCCVPAVRLTYVKNSSKSFLALTASLETGYVGLIHWMSGVVKALQLTTG